MSANDRQVSGKHYQTEIQPWDFIVSNNLNYLEGNVIKYVCRYKEKHYLDKLIEGLENVSLEKEEGIST